MKIQQLYIISNQLYNFQTTLDSIDSSTSRVVDRQIRNKKICTKILSQNTPWAILAGNFRTWTKTVLTLFFRSSGARAREERFIKFRVRQP